MKAFTHEQVASWLSENHFLASRSGFPVTEGEFYLQAEIRVSSSCDDDTRGLVHEIVVVLPEFCGALLEIIDWSWDAEYEDDPTLKLRKLFGEHRTLSEVPGYLFEAGERSDLIALIELVIDRGWSAYVYVKEVGLTFLFWEGEMIDIWGASEPIMRRIKEHLRKFFVKIKKENF